MSKLIKYDPNFEGVHVVQVTFMQWDYVGCIAYEMGGNCRGGDLLDPEFLGITMQEDIERYVVNDCEFAVQCDGDDYWFSAVLKNANGDELEVDGDDEDFKRMIVKLEIIEVRSESHD